MFLQWKAEHFSTEVQACDLGEINHRNLDHILLPKDLQVYQRNDTTIHRAVASEQWPLGYAFVGLMSKQHCTYFQALILWTLI